MPDFWMKQNDTLPSIEATLRDGSGAIIDLTDSTVRFHMRGKSERIAKVDSPAVIVDPTAGTVRYDWSPEDTDTPGDYQFEWQVTYDDGPIVTCPNIGYNTLLIASELG